MLNLLRAKFIINQKKTPTGSNCGIGSGGFKPGNTCALQSRGGRVIRLESVKKDKKGNYVLSNGKPLPKHIPKIPPGVFNVQINPDPNGHILVKWRDSKGRGQGIYSKTHSTVNAARKFSKVNELRKKKDAVVNEIRNDMKKPATREVATVLALIQHTGIRPGSDSNTKAEQQAYGATTLRAKHVLGKGTRLKFVGKKGVTIDIKVSDPELIKTLSQRKGSRKANDKLFDVTDSKLREYTHSKDGGGFNPKDFRTAKGTETAIALVNKMKPPKNEKEYKKAVKLVATKVSALLGNTPTIALQSYIDPTVFSSWRVK